MDGHLPSVDKQKQTKLVLPKRKATVKKEDLRVGNVISLWHKEYVVLALGKHYFFGASVTNPQDEQLLGYGSYDFKHATLVKAKKKIYCSVWTQASGYVWTVSDTDYQKYMKMVEHYLKSDFILIKDWGLEYSEDERVT